MRARCDDKIVEHTVLVRLELCLFLVSIYFLFSCASHRIRYPIISKKGLEKVNLKFLHRKGIAITGLGIRKSRLVIPSILN